MEVNTVKVLLEDSNNAPFDDWYESIADKKIRQAIASRLLRVRQGNFGDRRSVGGGVSELRIHLGAGYRVYYGRQGSSLIILIGGGTKRRQDQDILEAISLWERYRDEIERYSRNI